MKDLIISFLAVALLTGVWAAFDAYSEKVLDDCSIIISRNILPAVESEYWEESSAQAAELQHKWQNYRKKAMFFLSTEKLDEVDYTIAKSIKYIHAKDISNSSGELEVLIRQLDFLIKSEQVNAANIF